MKRNGLKVAMPLATMLLAGPAAAIPPPPPAAEIEVALPDDMCPVPLVDTVRGYQQPVFGFAIKAPTVIRLLPDPPDPALLVDVETAVSPTGDQPVVSGAGVTGGDIRIALPAAGRYRVRVLMVGDAARAGRVIAFRIDLSRAMESGAPPCRTETGP